MSTSESRAVSMMMGTDDSRRRMRQTSMPDSSGSIRSSSTRSGLLGAEAVQRLSSVGRGHDPQAVGGERLGHGLADGGLILHDQHGALARCACPAVGVVDSAVTSRHGTAGPSATGR